MNISVNFNADVQSRHVEHRAHNNIANVGNTAQPNSSVKNEVPAKPEQVTISAVNEVPKVDATYDNEAQRVETQTKTELQVNNSDYKIKMLIDRSVGNNTIQTVLNFYKIGLNDATQNSLQGNKDIDILV